MKKYTTPASKLFMIEAEELMSTSKSVLGPEGTGIGGDSESNGIIEADTRRQNSIWENWE